MSLTLSDTLIDLAATFLPAPAKCCDCGAPATPDGAVCATCGRPLCPRCAAVDAGCYDCEAAYLAALRRTDPGTWTLAEILVDQVCLMDRLGLVEIPAA